MRYPFRVTTRWHGDAELISHHRSRSAGERGLTWAANSGYEHLGLRIGQQVTLTGPDSLDLTKTVRMP